MDRHLPVATAASMTPRPDYAATARVELQKWFDADTTAQLIDDLRKAGLDIAAAAL